MALALDENPRNLFDRVLKKIKREYRNVQRASLRQRILNTPPAPSVMAAHYPYRVHMLVCKRDLGMSICASKSFVLAAAKEQPFVFHDDGSLQDRDVQALTHHFPGSKVIRYGESLTKAKEQFGMDSKLYHYRQKGVMMLKLLDVRLFAESEKVIILDSDILFFQYPKDLLESACSTDKANAYNKDIAPAYMTDLAALEQMAGCPLLPQLNAGLSVINVNTIDFVKLEQWLGKLHGQELIMHRIEQSLLAMLSAVSRYGAEYLPSGYDVSYFKDVHSSVCKHYVGRIRHGFEMEGLRYLLKRNFEDNWINKLKP